ncbi:hypothetical protein GJR96_09335 [Haloferax sp. MBLA0076]|uniref:Uncharacterized protein n=1 Tax=Haloferax litoreum TaxID=2666140 RepID=A0A6A8GGY1_9EURY|nr:MULTISPECIES: hypothetical protein [Haloferax]KAB1193631.1 hypothetical protein Hfx1148_09315 [Haloferax sp. CBA1148]MRX22156.1 hypothetical protein [Haloferax litoreum]
MNNRKLRKGIGFVLLLALIFGAAMVAQEEIGSSGFDSLDLTLSVGVSLLLATLYYQQKGILESQQELLSQEFNRDLRMEHTETLRERIELWYGEVNELHRVGEPGLYGSNLPEVTTTDIKSAPTLRQLRFGRDTKFSVMPPELEDDRYFQDLLENHAPDLRETKSEIEDTHERLIQARNSFIDNFDNSLSLETEVYTLSPGFGFDEWVFEQHIKLDRGFHDNVDDLVDALETSMENSGGQAKPEEGVWMIPTHEHRTPLKATFQSGNLDQLDEYQEEIQQAALREIKRILEGKSKTDERLIKEGSRELEHADNLLEKLNNLLIEYEGRIVYPGDCKYLDESMV